ncbi:MAG: ABC transporter ATP-binding protein [Candidatus Dormibacteria bacterium]
MTTIDGWRGVAGEEVDEVGHSASLFLRARSRRLLGSLLRPHRRAVWLVLGLVLLENLGRLAIPFLVGVGIDYGIPPLLHGRGETVLVATSLGILAAAIAQAASRRVFFQVSGRVGQDILLELRRRVFTHFQLLSVSFHERYTSGRVISRLTSDLDAISALLETGVDNLISAVLLVLGTGVLLLVLDWQLGLVTLAGFPILIWVTIWFRGQSSIAYRRTRQTVAVLILHFVESMRGIRAVQAFRREARNQAIFDGANDAYRLANRSSMRLVSVYGPSVMLIGNVMVGVVLIYGGYRIMSGAMAVGVLASFLLYLRQFFEPMQDMSEFYNSFQAANAALEKLSGVLEESPGVAWPEHPRSLAHPRGRVRFRDVRFAYRDAVVLPHLNLEIPAGQTVALVGATGAGKTTVARLTARLYDPVEGAVALDGIDLRDLDEPTLRQAVVMVTQESYMFSGTVADNIRFGRPDASAEAVQGAAVSVGADSFIRQLPLGYQSDVGKEGRKLSAGQRQLVAFARAFLANPAVLVLDEATASLDVPSERLVQRALQTVLSGRTALIVAHRLTTVEIADRVLILDGGRIVEDGTPSSLLASGGRYAALHQAWIASLA